MNNHSKHVMKTPGPASPRSVCKSQSHGYWKKIYVSILDSNILRDRGLEGLGMWIVLIMKASGKRVKLFYKNKPQYFPAGTLSFGVEKLAKEYGWTRGKMRSFISYLKNMKHIWEFTSQQNTIITIRNYAELQGCKEKIANPEPRGIGENSKDSPSSSNHSCKKQSKLNQSKSVKNHDKLSHFNERSIVSEPTDNQPRTSPKPTDDQHPTNEEPHNIDIECRGKEGEYESECEKLHPHSSSQKIQSEAFAEAEQANPGENSFTENEEKDKWGDAQSHNEVAAQKSLEIYCDLTGLRSNAIPKCHINQTIELIQCWGIERAERYFRYMVHCWDEIIDKDDKAPDQPDLNYILKPWLREVYMRKAENWVEELNPDSLDEMDSDSNRVEGKVVSTAANEHQLASKIGS